MLSPNDIRRDVRPPLLARWLLRSVAAARASEFALGDLEEEFHEQVDSPQGLRGARRWYWQQVWRCIVHPEAPEHLGEIPRSTGDGSMRNLWQDVRYGARALWKAPGFTLVAVLTLALGIGANTAIFSVTDAVLLRPLPYPAPEQLVALWEVNYSEGNSLWRVAPANYKDWREQADVFSEVAAFGGYAATMTGSGDPLQVKGGNVSHTYFATLGVQPIRGRAFEAADAASGNPVVVLGHSLWQSRFGASDDILGKSITLDGNSRVVIGVMPPGLYPAWPVNGPRMHFQQEYQDLWVLFPSQRLGNRRSHVTGVIARMKPGVQLQQAQEQMDVIGKRLAQAYPENRDEGVRVRPLMDEVAGSVRPALLILLGAVAAVLLMACSNIASLLLARLTARRHEIAVRCALGAGRAALVRQFLVEGLLIAALAGVAGVWLAYQGQGVLLSLVPEGVPRLADAGINLRVLAFTAGLSLLSALAFALAPAWSAGRVNVSDALKETSRGSEAAHSLKLRNVLVAAQVGLAVVLTLAAGLLIQSFARMAQIQPGFRTDNLVIAETSLSANKYKDWQQVVALDRRLLETVRSAPGVSAAHLAYDHPLETNWMTGFTIAERPDETTDTVQLRMVTPGYFAALGHTIREGREFEEREDATRPGVVVVSESFVRRYFPDGRAVGKTLLSDAATYGWRGQMPSRFEIIGVVNDVHPPGLESKPEPFFYLCAWQFPQREMDLLVRTSNEPGMSAAMLRRIANEIDPEMPIAKVITMEHVLSQAVAQPRLNSVLMSVFGALGLLLALVGVYGLIAFWVGARIREIGVRMALGATRASVLGMVLRRGAVLVLPGIAVGMVGAVLVSRVLKSQLYGISAWDPATFLLVPAAVALVGLLACALPAWSATRVDPVIALRNE